MSLIGRVELGPVFLRETLESVPDMTLRFEEFRLVADEPQLVVWATGGDFEAFEDALPDDPSVADYRYLSGVRGRRLYRVTFAQTDREKYLFPIVREQEITTLRSTITVDGIHLTARFPSREAVVALREACRDRDISFSLRQLYREESAASDGGTENRFGVTDGQREALLHALEAGYFDVPREAKLQQIAEEFDISTSALSTRLRRGQRNLLRNTLALEAPT